MAHNPSSTMKSYRMFVSSILTAALATTAFAQGKGGGGSHGGGAAGGFGQGAANPPSVARPMPAPDSAGKPAARADKPATPDNPARSAAPAAHDYTTTLHGINQTAFADRRQLLETADMSLKSSRDALKQIQARAKDARADARQDFKAALAEVKAREKELDSALKASRRADEANWNARRDALAKAYENHAAAMARLDAVAPPPKL